MSKAEVANETAVEQATPDHSGPREAATTGALQIEFCGEWYELDPTKDFTIGREADLTIDENPYLHRTFLIVRFEYGMWWLQNVGRTLSATISDVSGQVQSWLAPGSKLPIVFQHTNVMFSAGSTTSMHTLTPSGDGPTTAVGSSVVSPGCDLSETRQ